MQTANNISRHAIASGPPINRQRNSLRHSIKRYSKASGADHILNAARGPGAIAQRLMKSANNISRHAIASGPPHHTSTDHRPVTVANTLH